MLCQRARPTIVLGPFLTPFPTFYSGMYRCVIDTIHRDKERERRGKDYEATYPESLVLGDWRCLYHSSDARDRSQTSKRPEDAERRHGEQFPRDDDGREPGRLSGIRSDGAAGVASARYR